MTHGHAWVSEGFLVLAQKFCLITIVIEPYLPQKLLYILTNTCFTNSHSLSYQKECVIHKFKTCDIDVSYHQNCII